MPVTKIRSKWVSGSLVFTDSDGTTVFTISPTAVTAGSGMVFDVPLTVQDTAYTASGAITAPGMASLNNASASLTMTLADPGAAGLFLAITQIDSGTESHTVTAATAGAYDGTNEIATFNAQYETLVLMSVSSTRWVIVANIGSVGLST